MLEICTEHCRNPVVNGTEALQPLACGVITPHRHLNYLQALDSIACNKGFSGLSLPLPRGQSRCVIVHVLTFTGVLCCRGSFRVMLQRFSFVLLRPHRNSPPSIDLQHHGRSSFSDTVSASIFFQRSSRYSWALHHPCGRQRFAGLSPRLYLLCQCIVSTWYGHRRHDCLPGTMTQSTRPDADISMCLG